MTAPPYLRLQARAIAEQLGVGTAPQASVDRVAERIARLVEEPAAAEGREDRDRLRAERDTYRAERDTYRATLAALLDAADRARRILDAGPS